MHDTLDYFQREPDPPPLPPPPADVLAHVRVQRELRPAALARRGRARQGLAARRRCRATAGSSSRTCARSTRTCGRTPARSCSSWAASSRRSGSGTHDRSLDWHLLEQPEHAGVQSLVRDLNRVYRDEPALWEVDFEPDGFRWLEPNDAGDERARVRALRRRTRRGRSSASATSRPVPRERLPRRLPGRRPLARGAEHRLDVLRRLATSATSAASRPRPAPWHDQPFSAELTLPPLAVVWFAPEH